MNYFLKIILFFFFTTTIAFKSEIANKIVFVARTDYIKGHKTYKSENGANAYENNDTYNSIITKFENIVTGIKKNDFKINIIEHITVAQLINDKLNEFLKNLLSELGYKFEDIENFLQNKVEVNTSLLENFNDSEIDELNKFIDKVISEVILQKLDILQLTHRKGTVDYISFL